MKFIIAKLVNNSNNICGYRVLDLETYEYMDIGEADIINNFDRLELRNAVLDDEKIIGKYDSFTSYPSVRPDKTIDRNKAMVLYRVTEDSYAVCDANFSKQNSDKDNVRVVKADKIKEYVDKLANPTYFRTISKDTYNSCEYLEDIDSYSKELNIISAMAARLKEHENPTYGRVISTSEDGCIEQINLGADFEVTKFDPHSKYGYNPKAKNHTIYNIVRNSISDCTIKKQSLINCDIKTIIINGDCKIESSALCGVNIDEIIVNGNLTIEADSLISSNVNYIRAHGLVNIERFDITDEASVIGALSSDRGFYHLDSIINQYRYKDIKTVNNVLVTNLYKEKEGIVVNDSVSNAEAVKKATGVLDTSNKWIITQGNNRTRYYGQSNKYNVLYKHAQNGYVYQIAINEILKDAVVESISLNGYTGNIEVPEGVTEISNMQIMGESHADNIIIPNNVNLQNKCFMNSNIKGLIIDGNVSFIGRYAFAESTIETVKIKGNIDKVEQNAFNKANKLNQFTFAKCNGIKQYAFYNTTSLHNFDFDNVGYVEKFAFNNSGLVDDLNKGLGYELIIKQDGVDNKAKLMVPLEFNGKVVIPDGITSLGDQLFAFANISEIEIADTVNHLGEACFAYCAKLEKIKMSPKIQAIPEDCFTECKSLSNIDISNIKTISNKSFAFSGIKEAIFSEEVREIGIQAFIKCEELTHVKFPANFNKVRKDAFKGCKQLSNVEGLQNINVYEIGSFSGCNIPKIEIGTGVKALRAGVFTSNAQLAEVIIPDNCKTVEAAFSSNLPITYTLPKEMNSIDVSKITDKDTVKCYRQTYVDIQVQHTGCTVEYLDGGQGINRTKAMTKLQLISKDIPGYLRKKIKDTYGSLVESSSIEEPAGLLDSQIGTLELKMLGLESINIPDGYVEKDKFKLLLDYFTRVSTLNPIGLTSKIISCKDTFNVKIIREIYDDGISRMYEFEYRDNKYESIRARYIIALTGDHVRWMCYNNMYTNAIVDAKRSIVLNDLVRVFCPGDSIGDYAYIAGTMFENCKETVSIPNPITNLNEPVEVSLFDAFYQGSLIIKLEDRDKFWMILPNDNTLLTCTSSGAASYSSKAGKLDRGCTINTIEDYDTSETIKNVDKRGTFKHELLQKLWSLNDNQVKARIASYTYIGVESISPYTEIRNYCIQNRITKLSDLTSKQFMYLMQLPIVEEKAWSWYNKLEEDKTITPLSNSIIKLKDGYTLKLQCTRRLVKMTNALITGGNRKIYTYELRKGYQRKVVYSGMMPLQSILDYILNNNGSNNPKDLYKDTTKFDIVHKHDMYYISSLFTPNHEAYELDGEASYAKDDIWLAVDKKTGKYYITFIHFTGNDKVDKAVPLIRVGSMDVFYDYARCATSYTSSGAELLKRAADYAIYATNGNELDDYNKLLAARKLCIQGNVNVADYVKLGIPPVLANLFGVEAQNAAPVLKDIDIENIVDFEDDESEEYIADINIDNTSEVFNIDDDELMKLEEKYGEPREKVEETSEDDEGDIEFSEEDLADLDDFI